ncbi:tRNA (uridine(34)/cytosine(34)/5-carboxymethylaminomethyluridine(34)-2'-O)-methyltransferase TrmL [Rubeoparvulum massiliense]|uniref:tRNA (uridine(34)/cytosine(34)/5- carboxymethylaminomethyluridine(34)-2'-O)- methyltransferase TrmL n=1 Tax=Rubeoparvulum massiliense TaxID=1631346 RepID=UPI00065DCD0D|nr:tRNA (uridine(34)/cytosine(34)/5-carboxymethylaminomethyluridine(34)-2'-O)-methyltransferase TrmL [Rubeoparvulum massiliense]
MALHIVLYQPEIPSNTGNIARTCAGTGTHLHLIKPLGFSTDDRMLKRAGLDYWYAVNITYYDSFEQFMEIHHDKKDRMFFVETFANDRYYHEVEYQDEDFLILGRETKGIPKEILAQFPHQVVRLPMNDVTRSLNLSNVAAIVIFEALRQLHFPQMK